MAVGNAMVNTTKFEPLSIEQWAAPLKEYATRHEATENALLKLQEDADAYERYIINNPNTDVARQYKNYINSIENQISQLALNGITPQNRTDLTNLRKQYNDVIKPVKRAVTTYQDIVTQYNKDANKGVIGAPDIDVSYLLEHPEYTVNQYKDSYVLGTNVYNESKNLFKNLTGFNAAPQQYTDGNQIVIKYPQGYSSEELQLLFTDEDNPNLTQELKDTWKSIKSKYNFDRLTPDQQEQFIYYAKQGALSSAKPARYATKNVPKPASSGTSTKTTSGGRTKTGDDGEGL